MGRFGGMVLLLHHLLNGTFQLAVASFEIVGRRVVDFYVRIQLQVLAEPALHVLTAHLRNTEYHSVDEAFPPYGGHRSGYRGTYELADSECLVDRRESVSVAVVVLANQYARSFVHLLKGSLPMYLPVARSADTLFR